MSKNRLAIFIQILGFVILAMGCISSIIMADTGIEFNITVFVSGMTNTVIGMALVLGVAEIINKLHSIEINTRGSKDTKSTCSYVKLEEKSENVGFSNDLEKCPACGHKLSKKDKECPDCGLSLE